MATEEPTIEGKTIACSGANDAAAALAALTPLASPAFEKAYSDAWTAYDALSDDAGDPPYQAQVPAVEAMIQSIEDFATDQGFPACP